MDEGQPTSPGRRAGGPMVLRIVAVAAVLGAAVGVGVYVGVRSTREDPPPAELEATVECGPQPTASSVEGDTTTTRFTWEPGGRIRGRLLLDHGGPEPVTIESVTARSTEAPATLEVSVGTAPGEDGCPPGEPGPAVEGLRIDPSGSRAIVFEIVMVGCPEATTPDAPLTVDGALLRARVTQGGRTDEVDLGPWDRQQFDVAADCDAS